MDFDKKFQENQAKTIAMAKNPFYYLSEKEKEIFKSSQMDIEKWVLLIFDCTNEEFIKERIKSGPEKQTPAKILPPAPILKKRREIANRQTKKPGRSIEAYQPESKDEEMVHTGPTGP